MTTLRTALRSAIETGDASQLSAAGFAHLDEAELRDAIAAFADQQPAAIGALLEAAALEPDVTAVLDAARSALASTVGPAPLRGDLVAGADPTDDLDFGPWQSPAPTAEPGPVDHDLDEYGDDLDFGSGGEAPAELELLGDPIDDVLESTPTLDDHQSFATEEPTIDDPFAIGPTDLDDADRSGDEDGDDFL